MPHSITLNLACVGIALSVMLATVPARAQGYATEESLENTLQCPAPDGSTPTSVTYGGRDTEYRWDSTGELDLRSPGAPAGYAFLFQSMRDPYTGALLPGGMPDVHIEVKARSRTPVEWYADVNDTVLAGDLTFRWYAQASCPDDLTNLQVNGPGGTLTQSPLYDPIYGYFETQSFTVQTIKDICVKWATETGAQCLPPEPGVCQIKETFILEGGTAPTTNADRLQLKASCTSGPVANRYYAPRMKLVCHRTQ